MELSHEFIGPRPLDAEALARAPGPGPGIAHELLQRGDVPRHVLVAALQESRRRLENMLSCVSGTFYRCAVAPPWRMTFVSAGIEAITGHDCAFFENTPYGELILEQDRPALERAIARAVARGERFSVSYRLRHRSGAIRWVSEKGVAVYDEAGEAQFLEGYIADITETRELELEAEEAREEAEALNEKLSNLLESTLDCVMSFDRAWRMTFANGRAMEEIGRHGYAGWSGDLPDFAPVSRTPIWTVLQDVMARRRPQRIEGRVPGMDVWLDIYAVPDGEGVTVFFRNIGDRKALEHALRSKAADLNETLDSIAVMVWTTNPDGTGDYYNRSWKNFVGRTAEEAREQSRHPSDWLHPEDRRYAFDLWRASLRSGEPFEMEVRLQHHADGFRWVLARVWPFRDRTGAIVKWYGAATDIHERIVADRNLQESLRLQRSLLNSSEDYIKVLDLQGRILLINEKARRDQALAGTDDIVGKVWPDLWQPNRRRTIRNAVRRAAAGKPVGFVMRGPGVGGRECWWDVRLSPVTDDAGGISNLLCMCRDVTDAQETTERLRTVSEQDFLTSLPNRRAFERRLKRATARATERGRSVGLMLLDLDHFKHVNDTLGHLAGDRLLRVVARRLQGCATDRGFVARLGGDEFAVVLDDIADEMDLLAVSAQILARMERPVTYQGKLIHGGLSIGCAIYPRDAADAQGLLKHADTALYDLKTSGRGGIQMFNSQMKEAAERTASQLSLARRVIHEDAVEPYYQPKVRLETGAVAGFEALLRWWCPASGIQLPSTVAEAFNDYELSTKIGGLMQRRVLADMANWLSAGLNVLPISINASPAEFLRDDYAERLLQRIAEYGVAPSLIEVEITEHVFLERRSELVIRALLLLKDAGVRIALDDFGTGHSSLSHLRDFPVDAIKIDRSFVDGMLAKQSMFAIVQAIAKLGPSLAVDIVAEGIETPEQLHALRDAGCAMGQGYLFGRAMDSREATERLAQAVWPFRVRTGS